MTGLVSLAIIILDFMQEEEEEEEEEEEDYDERKPKKPRNRFVIEEAGKCLVCII